MNILFTLLLIVSIFNWIRSIFKNKYLVFRMSINSTLGGFSTDYKKFKCKNKALHYVNDLKKKYPNDNIYLDYV